MNAFLNDGAFDAARANVAAFRLEDQGFCIIRKLASPTVIDRVARKLDSDFDRTPFCRGPFYGEHTKRFGRLLSRSESSASLVLQPILLEMVKRVLGPWCDTIQLNVAQAIEIHPGAPAQYPHRDQDMWRGVGRFEYLVNVIWPLTSFTVDNGATMLWPDTHGARAMDSECDTGAIVAEAEPGDAIVFLGSTLHGAGANTSAATRRGIVIGYSLGWLRAYENQSLAYPPEIARRFPPELAAMVGYRQHPLRGQTGRVRTKKTPPERIKARPRFRMRRKGSQPSRSPLRVRPELAASMIFRFLSIRDLVFRVSRRRWS